VDDGLVGKRYYEPTTHGAEARVSERSERIRAILRGNAEPGGERAGTRAGTDPEPAAGSERERAEPRAASGEEPG
jgi:hypothetical protein